MCSSDLVYILADQCEPALHIRSVAEAVGTAIPGFAAATYPTWDALLTTLADRVTARTALLID